MGSDVMRPTMSVVAPVWNEVEGVAELVRRIAGVLDSMKEFEGEIVIGDDGSTDGTLELLLDLASREPRIVVVRLSRNFGHQACLLAAMKEARGDVVVLMDGDLEDPPEEIPRMVEAWRAGVEIVLGVRISRKDRLHRRILFAAFHKLIGWLSDVPLAQNTGTFCLLTRRAADSMILLGETNRFLPGIRAWIGFERGQILYHRQKRFAGEPHQSMGRLFRYAFDAIFGFSHKPLRLSLYVGAASWGLSAVYALALVVTRILRINVVPGFTTTSVLVLFFGGMSLMSLGILGEYLGRVYDEVKRRPAFIVKSVHGRGA